MIVGLTGGIGSGKTTVAEIFKHLKVPVFTADEESKKLLDTDKELQQKLKELLGPELMKDGQIDKKWMATQIFSDETLLQKANAIIHPAVGKAFKNWHQQQKAPYVLREAAILFESGTHQDCAQIVVVVAPEALRLERVMKRSGETEAQVKERMNKQWPQEKKEALADYVIRNYNQHSLIKQVIAVHENLIRTANA